MPYHLLLVLEDVIEGRRSLVSLQLCRRECHVRAQGVHEKPCLICPLRLMDHHPDVVRVVIEVEQAQE